MLLAASLIVIAAVIYALLREVDIRLVLFAGGLCLTSLAGAPGTVLEIFQAEMGNGKTIGPICSAMGYAFVLRATGCDQEMVKLLLKPVSRVRWLLIPAGCAVGFVTNIAVTSQTASVAAVGPVLMPLMLAAGYPPLVVAGTLVLGCSGGGSLYNPADADLIAIHEASGASLSQVLQGMFLPLLGGFVAAVLLFTLFSQRTAEAPATNPTVSCERVNLVKALLPPLPVIMIFLMLPGSPWASALGGKGLPVSHAMILATAIVLLVERKAVSNSVKCFFEGMGYAYVNVISIIITASCFIAGLTQVGLTAHLIDVVSGTSTFGKVAAGIFPGLLAVISGSGIGPSAAFSKAVLPTLQHDLPLAIDLGVLAAIAATFGRTLSPVAAVVIFSATMTGVSPWSLVRRLAPPLLMGFAVVLCIVLARGN